MNLQRLTATAVISLLMLVGTADTTTAIEVVKCPLDQQKCESIGWVDVELASVDAGVAWLNTCSGSLTYGTEATHIEGTLIDTPLIDFVKVEYTHVEQTVTYEFSCNVEVQIQAIGAGGLSRNVFVKLDNTQMGGCSYSGVSPNTWCMATHAFTAVGPSGGGTVEKGGEIPSGVEVCIKASSVIGENHQAPINIDVVTDSTTDLCTTLPIHYANGGGGDLAEGILCDGCLPDPNAEMEAVQEFINNQEPGPLPIDDTPDVLEQVDPVVDTVMDQLDGGLPSPDGLTEQLDPVIETVMRQIQG